MTKLIPGQSTGPSTSASNNGGSTGSGQGGATQQLRYDVAISVAGPDTRAVGAAGRLAERLRRVGVNAYFYLGTTEEDETTGRELRPFLEALYAERARLVVVLESESYGATPLTAIEWRWIQGRRQSHPDERFLIPVRLEASIALGEELEKLGYLDFSGTADGDLAKLGRLVVRRLGIWSRAKAATYTLVVSAATAAFTYRYLRSPLMPGWVGATWYSVVFLVPAWFGVFFCLFRFGPGRRRRSLWRQRLFGSVGPERVTIALLVVLCVVGFVGAGDWQEQLDRSTAAWLGDEPPARTAALTFFTRRVGLNEAYEVWLRLLVQQPDADPRARGRALEMLYRLDPAVSARLRSAAEQRRYGLSPGTWRSVSLNTDLSSASFDDARFAEMQFTGGRAPNWVATAARRADVSAAWFWGNDLASADLGDSDLARVRITASTGPTFFTGAQLQQACFLGGDFAGSSFMHADLTGAKFSGCSLTGADFSNCSLTGTSFEDCDLSGAIFGGPIRRAGVWGRFAGAVFVRCRFAGVDLREMSFGPATTSLILRPCAGQTQPSDPATVVANPATSTAPAGATVRRVEIGSAVFVDCDFAGADVEQLADTAGPADAALSALAAGWQLDLREELQRERLRSLVMAPSGLLCPRLKSMGVPTRKLSLPPARFDGVKSLGTRVDRTTWDRLSDEQRLQLQTGGFDERTLLKPAATVGALDSRFPELRPTLWPAIESTARSGS